MTAKEYLQGKYEWHRKHWNEHEHISDDFTAREMEAYHQAKKILMESGESWVSVESKVEPERVTEVLVKYEDGRKEVALFDGDGRFYIERADKDITEMITEWHKLP